MSEIIDARVLEIKSAISSLVDSLSQLSDQVGQNALTASTAEIRERLHDPFMFVIVGEVKAGKSSFINALLDTGEEICKVGPAPLTDSIQEIIYGEHTSEEVVNPHFKIIRKPIDILKDIAIVDTPGTNTIIEHHQEITERFIPISDLIVFVFEAKNPYRQSSWDFFDYIHEDWRKKVLFILQQKDLLGGEDLQTNMEGVRKHAAQKGMEAPRVFAVSAKQELEGEKDISGFEPLRKWIIDQVTGGKSVLLKLESHLGTVANISSKITDAIAIRKRQYLSDLAFRKEIAEALSEQKGHALRQVDILTDNLISSYDKISKEKVGALSSGLAFPKVFKRTVSSMFDKNASIKQWLSDFLKDIEVDFQERLKAKLNESVVDLAESVQQMATIIDLKIRDNKTILKEKDDIFSDIAQRRGQVLRELQSEFSQFLKGTENFKDPDLFPQSDTMSPNLAAGSGIAIVGVLLATVTSGMVFDITGGILTALGMLFAGVSLGLQRRKLVRRFRSVLESGRSKLDDDVRQKLRDYVVLVGKRIEENFTSFDNLLAEEEVAISGLESSIEDVDRRAASLAEDLISLKRDVEFAQKRQD